MICYPLATLMLAMTHRHTLHAGAFPQDHRDPFDRTLAAQAEIEQPVPGTRDPAFALVRFAAQFPQAQAVQLARDLRQPGAWRGIHLERAAQWLAHLDA